MTVKELKEALPWDADNAEVFVAAQDCKYGDESAVAEVFVQTNKAKPGAVVITAIAPEGGYARE